MLASVAVFRPHAVHAPAGVPTGDSLQCRECPLDKVSVVYPPYLPGDATARPAAPARAPLATTLQYYNENRSGASLCTRVYRRRTQGWITLLCLHTSHRIPGRLYGTLRIAPG